MENTLNNLKEFQALLQKYKASDEVIEQFKQIPFIALVAPTSGGRNSIINELVKTGKYAYVVSDTTRQPRTNDGVEEKQGVNYHFKSEEDFLQGLKDGKYLEAEFIHDQQVSGIHIDEVRKAQKHGKIAITDMNIIGGELVVSLSDNARTIFITPPSFDVWMQRLIARGNISQDELQRRLIGSEKVIEQALESNRFWFLRNDDLKEAVTNIRDIIEHKEPDYAENESSKQVAWRVLGQLKTHLNS